jgi:putative cell wall-binding protein
MRRALALAVVAAIALSLTTPLAAADTPPETAATGVDVHALAKAATGLGASVSVTYADIERPDDVASTVPSLGLLETQLISAGFETWPGPWLLWSETDTGWGRTTYRKTQGSYAAYCAGSRINAPGPYANNMNTWMTLGPFDLRAYENAHLRLDLRFLTELNHDAFGIGVSTDNSLYHSIIMHGDSGGWWVDTGLDLADFQNNGLVNVTGQPRVWVGILFQSDGAGTAEGAYVDNVRITGFTPAIELTRPTIYVSGRDRIETALLAAQWLPMPGIDTVVIATGRNWPDALGGSALAGVLNAPILLTEPGKLPPDVLNYIRSRSVGRAVILGGEAAVGAAVKDALTTELGVDAVERIAGLDRYETADKVAARVIAEQGDEYDGVAFVATGANFPDALAAAPLAAANGWPIFLSSPLAGIASATRSAMTGVTHVNILGGEMAIPTTVGQKLSDSGLIIKRIAGSDRYQTAATVAEYGVTDAGLSWSRLGFATGDDYPDALAGGVLQGAWGSVMLLTPPYSLDPEVRATIWQHRNEVDDIVLYGGLGAVSQRARNDIYRALEGY